MISCTDFIPSYSELFSYLEENYGRAEVDRYWNYLFEPTGDGIPLINFVKKEGIRGCFTYWSGTLNEEAADFTLYLDEAAGWFMIAMHKCPSKGRLLEFEKTVGIKPYHDYCLHCDNYRLAVEKVGLCYQYNFVGIEKAACTLLIYDPKVFDGRIVVRETTKVMDRKASDNEYFHRDFHSSLNMGVDYLGKKYGLDVLKGYLRRYTKNVVMPQLVGKGEPLSVIGAWIADTYKKEKAEEDVRITLDRGTLTVKVSKCPAVTHLHDTGRVVSSWYRYTTETVMETVASECGLDFTMVAYDDNSGAAEYRFSEKK